MFATLVGASVLMIPISFVLSNIFKISKDFRRTLFPMTYELADRKAKDEIKGQLKSCALIRCKVGNLYHMEVQAKLTMLDRTVNGVVFLLVKVKG